MATKTAAKPVQKGNTKSVSATLDSLKKASASATDTAPVPVVDNFDWNTLPEATIAVYTRNATVRKDLEETTPAFIKGRVSQAFEATAKKGVDGQGRPQPVWFVQNCGTEERAEEFLKMARQYASFKDYTLRGTANPEKLAAADGSFTSGTGMVKFAVKVRETRKAKKS